MPRLTYGITLVVVLLGMVFASAVPISSSADSPRALAILSGEPGEKVETLECRAPEVPSHIVPQNGLEDLLPPSPTSASTTTWTLVLSNENCYDHFARSCRPGPPQFPQPDCPPNPTTQPCETSPGGDTCYEVINPSLFNMYLCY